MQCFLDNPPNIPDYKMKTINKCRIFLQAFSLADISTGDGNRITKKAWVGKKSDALRHITGWPQWGNPSTAEWKVWRKSLTSTFSNNVANRYISEPLGQCHINGPQTPQTTHYGKESTRMNGNTENNATDQNSYRDTN